MLVCVGDGGKIFHYNPATPTPWSDHSIESDPIPDLNGVWFNCRYESSEWKLNGYVVANGGQVYYYGKIGENYLWIRDDEISDLTNEDLLDVWCTAGIWLPIFEVLLCNPVEDIILAIHAIVFVVIQICDRVEVVVVINPTEELGQVDIPHQVVLVHGWLHTHHHQVVAL